MWGEKNVVETGRSRWQYGACALRKTSHTLICNTYCFSTATVVTRMRLSVTRYIACRIYCRWE